jgi:hypothetical protein
MDNFYLTATIEEMDERMPKEGKIKFSDLIEGNSPIAYFMRHTGVNTFDDFSFWLAMKLKDYLPSEKPSSFTNEEDKRLYEEMGTWMKGRELSIKEIVVYYSENNIEKFTDFIKNNLEDLFRKKLHNEQNRINDDIINSKSAMYQETYFNLKHVINYEKNLEDKSTPSPGA